MGLLDNMKWNYDPCSLTIREGVEFNNGDANSLFMYCYGYNNNFVIPEGTTNTSNMFRFSNMNSNVTFCEGIEDASWMFAGCMYFNQLLDIPDFTNDCSYMFSGCYRFNRPMHVPYCIDSTNIFGSCSTLNAMVTFDDYIDTLVGTFYGCYNFNRRVTLPSELTNGISVFERCDNLNQNIQIPSGAVCIDRMFAWCWRLDQAIYIPQSVEYMNYTFDYCRNLTQYIELPDGLISAVGTFYDCSNYDYNVQIPSSVIHADGMLAGTPINYNIQLPSSVQTVGGMFKGCRNLDQNIHIPDSVTSVSAMFEDCQNLNKNIILPTSNLRSVTNVFMNCYNLYIPSVTIGQQCNDISNICARTKIRNVRAYNNAFFHMNHVFQAVENNHTLDLSGLQPITFNWNNDGNVEDWGDPIFTITVPYNATLYWWTTRQDVLLRSSFMNGHAAEIFGAEMSFYNWRLIQSSNYEEWLNNVWCQEHARASIFPMGFNANINCGVCHYADWQNTYYDSYLEQNVTPRYACFMRFV